MQRRTFISRTGITGLMILTAPADIVQAFSGNINSTLEEDFLQPPAAAFPQIFWIWMNGNVTKEGITLDLEAMKQTGISGLFNYDAGAGIPKGPVPYLSAEWLELKKYAMDEAERLGLDFTLHNCPGWSASGGPWITPELAMQEVTWSEAYISGGTYVNTVLRKPIHRLEYYRDIAVLAFPALQGEAPLPTLLNNISSGNGVVDMEKVIAEDAPGIAVYPAANSATAYLQFEFKESYEARFINFYISSVEEKNKDAQNVDKKTAVVLQASDDGILFHTVTTINTGLKAGLMAGNKFITYDFPVTKAKYFRLVSTEARHYAKVRLSGVARLKNFMEKGGYRFMFSGEGISNTISNNDQEVSATSVINLNDIIDISRYITKEGVLQWHAPSGDWTIVRIGYTPTGAPNRAAPDNGVGLECDKFSSAAFDFHFHKMMEHLLPILKPLIVKGKAGLEIDSYEAGIQNWTPLFPQEFQKRREYDLLKYLPTLTGRIVDSVNKTERFLWDFRRTQADLMADHYYGRFGELCRQYGLTSYIEPYDRGPMEEIQIGSRADVTMGEFWNGLFSILQNNLPIRRTSKLAASIAHINGKKIVGAEAFTSEPESGRWQAYPFSLKLLSDNAFTKGINKIIIHRFAHQPHPTAAPGMTMGTWGIHFDRTNTWWNQSKEWLTYLARCQHLLRHGLLVADLAYFTGEDANLYTKVNRDELHPPPPKGYDYDVMNAEVILNRVKIVDHLIVLPDGMSYKILVLQNYKAITSALLHQLRDLVEQGMILFGALPECSLGLSDYADNDSTFNQIANELWGDIDGTIITEHRFGKGRVFWGISLLSLLKALKLPPDFEVSSRSGTAPVNYIHRKRGDADIYFLSNKRRTCEDTVCTFRISNKQPELWDAVTGSMTPVAVYEFVDDCIRMPVQLEPYGSVFIIFRSPASPHRWQSVEKDNEPVLSTKLFHSVSPQLYKEVTNNFTIVFWAKPEMNIMLRPSIFMSDVKNPWTDYYALYPASGEALYGEGHAVCGLAVGRNGVAVWENSNGDPVLVLAAPTAISGWAHIGLIYKEGAPLVYVNGKLIKKGNYGGKTIHPGSDKVLLNEGNYYNSDKSDLQLFTEILSEDRIKVLAEAELSHLPASPFVAEIARNKKPALLIWQNGIYRLKNNAGQTSFHISEINKPLEIEGAWQVNFPPDLGAPSKIILPQLISLHRHPDNGVKYFSGTITYTKGLRISVENLTAAKRLFLDLGRVEVIAEVNVNDKNLGTLWKRPYRTDITDAIKEGVNYLTIKVTNLWPNRLIGDEQLPDPDKFLINENSNDTDNGAIQQLPDWYLQGKPKPDNGRITFTTWKHYTKDAPLLESGLIGPVVLLTAYLKTF